MIYTVPISVLCSPKNIVNSFGERHIVSIVDRPYLFAKAMNLLAILESVSFQEIVHEMKREERSVSISV